MKIVKSIFFPFFFLLFALCPFLLGSCDSDDDGNQNEQELITTVRLTFTQAGSSPAVFEVQDLDGDGGNPPVADTIVLEPLSQYSLSVELLDESDVTQTEDLTEEVAAEASAHQVCYTFGSVIANQNISDFDNLGKPLGLESTVMTGVAGTGTFQVSLKHLPDKNSATPCATGETDAEVTFPVLVQ